MSTELQSAYRTAVEAMGRYIGMLEVHNTPVEEMQPVEWYDWELVSDRLEQFATDEQFLEDVVMSVQAVIRK